MSKKCNKSGGENSIFHFTLLNAFERLIKNDVSLPEEFGEWDFEKQCAFINDTNSVAHFEIGGELRHKVKALEIEISELKREQSVRAQFLFTFLELNDLGSEWDDYIKNPTESFREKFD